MNTSALSTKIPYSEAIRLALRTKSRRGMPTRQRVLCRELWYLDPEDVAYLDRYFKLIKEPEEFLKTTRTTEEEMLERGYLENGGVLYDIIWMLDKRYPSAEAILDSELLFASFRYNHANNYAIVLIRGGSKERKQGESNKGEQP